MNEALTSTLMPTPLRAVLSDDPEEILRFAIDAYRDGSVALATLVEIRGGAARALGSHVAVAADGRFSGYVSGGCVEAAVAAEALLAMAEGKDRTVKLGEGSRFFDIVLPCGGGITVAIHLIRNVGVLKETIVRLGRRQSAALRYSPELQLLEVAEPPARACWSDGQFISIYRPKTRVLIFGQNVEAVRVKQLAVASGYDIAEHNCVQHHQQVIDAFTAVVMLHHDLEAEHLVMEAALGSPAFYIGALGSTRTHHRRVEHLRRKGWDSKNIDRIKAPIGSFGPTRDSSSLALSILGDIAASRLMVYG